MYRYNIKRNNILFRFVDNTFSTQRGRHVFRLTYRLPALFLLSTSLLLGTSKPGKATSFLQGTRSPTFTRLIRCDPHISTPHLSPSGYTIVATGTVACSQGPARIKMTLLFFEYDESTDFWAPATGILPSPTLTSNPSSPAVYTAEVSCGSTARYRASLEATAETLGEQVSLPVQQSSEVVLTCA